MNNTEFKLLLSLSKLCEGFHSSRWESDVCLARSIHEGRVETEFTPGGRIIAYVETWRITQKQVSYILKGRFDFLRDSINFGEVLWIANVSVHPEFRGDQSIVSSLWKKVLLKNQDATLIGGEYNGTRKREKRFNLISMKRITHGVLKNCY